MWLARGNCLGREQVQISELISLHPASLKWLPSHPLDWRTHLPREEYLNTWLGKTPSVYQVWEGVGGRWEEGEKAARGPAFAVEYLSGRRVLC